jgi:UDP-N-acetylglucosamine 1-carboxyvinyltransferase
MMAAVLAEGMTIIENAACEPHIVDLANFFNTCGASISGAGTNVIKIRGAERLHGCTYEIIPDMIEAGTYMTAVAATGGKININNIIPKHLESITAKLRDMGVEVEEFDDSLTVTAKVRLKPTQIQTKPYPGFPTDMQPQFTALMCMAFGESGMTENVFEHRYHYVNELRKMGGDIEVDGRYAKVNGRGFLHGANVKATDLRAGAALIVAGLAAVETTTVTDIVYIKRGYQDIVNKFRDLGADIEEVWDFNS